MRQSALLTLALPLFAACGDTDDHDNTPIVLEPTVLADTTPHAIIDVRTPAPFHVGDTALLDGSSSLPTDAGLTFAWSLLSVPDSSAAALQEPAVGLAELAGDLAGEYIVQLTVTNESGDDSTFALVSFLPPPTCISNSDCPEPTAVCDIARSTCVECLVLSDCSHRPGTVCDQGSCACASDLDWCAPDLCVDLATDSNNCGMCGRECFGSCMAGDCADPWEPTSMEGAPTPRQNHVAVWAADPGVMIVWGGSTNSGPTNTGGIYDPATLQWTPTSMVNAPESRERATAVWTGTEMIVWGGQGSDSLETGGRFDPQTNAWTPTSTSNVPEGHRFHTAVWTGSEMIVWGGLTDAGDEVASGARYAPADDTWTAVTASTVSRRSHTAVWSGTAMLTYGGYGDTPSLMNVYLPAAGAAGGETYNPSGNSWLDLNTIGQPTARSQHTAVHDGTQMIVWGGFNGSSPLGSGARFAGGAWSALNGRAPEARQGHTAVFVAGPRRMVIWGGEGSTVLATGGEYDPQTNQWIGPTPTAPQGRVFHTAVSTGTQMIVWGGQGLGGARLNNGAIYTPGL